MPLSWNEIKSRAAAFSKEWEHEVSEDAEAKSFWDGFFNVFGIGRRRVATFEQQVKKNDAKTGFIDLLWKGVMLVEHKSRGKDLDKAFKQAKDYFPGLTEKELPKYILVSDFERFRLYNLEEGARHEFNIRDLVQHVNLFGFIAGYQPRSYKEQHPVNIEAAELMGKLHDKLKAIGYTGHQLELYLVRLLFCLFADDSNIFEKSIFHDYIDLKTNEDGTDLAAHIGQIFQVLNTPDNKRYRNLDEALAAFPYVNGKLFEEQLPMPHFDSSMRKSLLDCCLLDWGKISPAIFGSLFQSVMDDKARRNLGAHYTSEKNILKLINPLFLDKLRDEFEQVKTSKAKLQKFHQKISSLKFLDPACGCGNFLIIAYREIRLIEIQVIKQLLKLQGFRDEVIREARMDVSYLIKCDVDQFYGIEYEEFPAQIAQVAMWLMDHQMNQLVTQTFGEYYVRLPLKKSATIICENALRIDWQSLIDQDPLPWDKTSGKYNYILGNPPFIGKHLQTAAQKNDMELVLDGVNGAGVMDYVAAWYVKAATYMEKHSTEEEKDLPRTKVAFVSTNSITQGEQVGILWNQLFNKYNCKIHFAHRTFKWGNEAKGNAAVHVVIIGFANFNTSDKLIFEYDDIRGEPHELAVKNINPYLIEGNDTFLLTRKKPICNVPEMLYGNKIVDGGFYLFTDDEKKAFLESEPNADPFFKPILSGEEFINGKNRWVLYLKDADPKELKQLPLVLQRINSVKKYRASSPKKQTQELALIPTVFAEPRQPESDFLLVPRTSSENRRYIPFGFFSKNFIVNDSCVALPNASKYHFGIMSSLMHMAWVKYVCGRLKSDYRYSNSLVYNNFPWPEDPTKKQSDAVEDSANHVLAVRGKFKNSSLADLYDAATMPPELTEAHKALDKAVDLSYRSQPFASEAKRIEFLFDLFEKYTAGLFVPQKTPKTKNKK